jgi:hypothetical protein
MLNHRERKKLAGEICTRMVSAHPKDIIIGALYGSTSSGLDTEWSDLEMLFIVKDDSKLEKVEMLYKGTAVGLYVLKKRELESHLKGPTLQWPFWMGVLSVLKVLHGDRKNVEGWLRSGRSVPERRFRALLEKELPGLVIESHGRIHSCQLRKNKEDIGCAVIEVLLEMNLALCLLNMRWVTHDYYRGFVDAFSFPKLPERYKELVPALWSSRDIDEIVPLADELVGSYFRLLEREGIEVKDHQAPNEMEMV